jgi:RNA-directed DNA polymerase
MNKRVLAKWLRCGIIDHGARYPTTAGVPQGGIISPVISNLVLDGLEAVVHGSPGHRRVHHINYVRWADDFLVTATSRQELAAVVQPRIEAFLAERGVRLSLTVNSLLMSKNEPYDRVSANQSDEDENVNARSRT